ncbi:hypothetical protein V6N13_100291 [Hibiscus sabdariffa]|uniref:Uncharacterized protein n=1 Tax=Hibiscus sabdariffa TaxID=183260 RepID=A0ABR1ZU83_9ROSI
MKSSENLGNPTIMHSLAPIGRQSDFMVVGASLVLEGVDRQVNGLAPIVAGEDMLLDARNLSVDLDTSRMDGG